MLGHATLYLQTEINHLMLNLYKVYQYVNYVLKALDNILYILEESLLYKPIYIVSHSLCGLFSLVCAAPR